MPDARFEELTEDECRELLADHHLGRLAIVQFGGPMIFPVNYVFDRDAVVFRTDPGSKLDAAEERDRVAFEETRYLRVRATSITSPYQPALRQARINSPETRIMAGLTPAEPANTNEKFKTAPKRP